VRGKGKLRWVEGEGFLGGAGISSRADWHAPGEKTGSQAPAAKRERKRYEDLRWHHVSSYHMNVILLNCRNTKKKLFLRRGAHHAAEKEFCHLRRFFLETLMECSRELTDRSP